MSSSEDLIIARPTKSEIRWVQCLGRGLRTAPGKDKCLIFDHSACNARPQTRADLSEGFECSPSSPADLIETFDIKLKTPNDL